MGANEKRAATFHGGHPLGESVDARRGRVAWHMSIEDVLIGHDLLGFDYPISGDTTPTKHAVQDRGARHDEA